MADQIDDAKMREAFDEFDADKSGHVSVKEVKNVLLAMGLCEDMSTDISTRIFEKDADKQFTFEEFKAAILDS